MSVSQLEIAYRAQTISYFTFPPATGVIRHSPFCLHSFLPRLFRAYPLSRREPLAISMSDEGTGLYCKSIYRRYSDEALVLWERIINLNVNPTRFPEDKSEKRWCDREWCNERRWLANTNHNTSDNSDIALSLFRTKSSKKLYILYYVLYL